MQVSTFSAFVVIAVSALAGQRIVGFLGISIASFQVGGGMLLRPSSLGISIMTRLMGLILAPPGVEIMADRLLELFPVLGSARLRSARRRAGKTPMTAPAVLHRVRTLGTEQPARGRIRISGARRQVTPQAPRAGWR
jgi:hypothetical protein